MAKKKNTQIAVSQEDNTQAQHILEQYHEIAGNLHTSTDQKQAEDALTEINNMPEGAQMNLPTVEAARSTSGGCASHRRPSTLLERYCYRYVPHG